MARPFCVRSHLFGRANREQSGAPLSFWGSSSNEQSLRLSTQGLFLKEKEIEEEERKGEKEEIDDAPFFFVDSADAYIPTLRLSKSKRILITVPTKLRLPKNAAEKEKKLCLA